MRNEPAHWEMTSEDRENYDKARGARELRRQKPFAEEAAVMKEENRSESSKKWTKEAVERASEMRVEVKGIFEKMSKMCNRSQENELIDELVYNLDHEHRTLQQSFVKVLVGVLDAYADSSFDGRNADAVRFARKFRKTFKNEMYLPLI
jgi:hypothetical protein